MLDGSATAAVGNWGLGRYAGLGLVELVAPIEPGHDVRPIDLGCVYASSDTRGTPSALVGIVREGTGYVRTFVPVQVDTETGAGMSDLISRLASPLEDDHVGMAVEGSSLFAWVSPNPALGPPSGGLGLGLTPADPGVSKPPTPPGIAPTGG